MSDSESPAAGVSPAVGVSPAAGLSPAGGGLLVPALLFGFYLMAAASGGALLAVGTRIYELTAGWTAPSGLALVVTIALGAILGSWTAGRRAGSTAAPGATLALLQASFGLAVLLSVLLFRGARAGYLALWPSIGGSEAGAWGLRFVLALALLFVPATLFFGMQPMLARLIVAGRQGYGIACGFAFGLSLAGLALGTVAGGDLFLPNLGIRGSLLMGVALSGLAAAGTTLVRQRGLEGPGALGANLSGGELVPGGAPQDEETLIDDEIIAGGTLAAANMLVGFAAWGYLIAWSRTLTFIVGGTTESKATIAGVYLLGLALGAFLMSGIVERIGRLLISLTVLLMASSMVAHVSMYLAAPAAMLYLRLSPLLDRPGLSELPAALTAASLMLPACLLLGGALPLLPLVARQKGRPMAGTISFLAIGVILAELTIGMVVVPAFGLRRTVSLAGAVGLLSAILFVGAVSFRRPALRTTWAVGLLGLMVVLGGFPASWDPRVISAGLYRYGARALERFRTPEQYMAARRTVEVLFYREGRNASVMVERTMQSPAPGAPPGETIALTVDGKVDATTGEDLRAQILQAHIPILIHGPTSNALLIGFLNGVSAGSILRHPVTAVSILEPEPVLFEAAAAFTDYNRRPLEDSRVATLVDDPRARLLVERAAYDVIIVGAMDPWLPQSAALLTDEGYRLLGSRLRPGGLLAQRISVSSTSEAALKALLRTFMRAFGSVLAFQTSPEDLLLLGSSEPLGIDAGWIRNVLGSSASVAQDLGRALPLGVNGILLQFRGGGETLRALIGDGPINDDDRAIVEVASSREITVHDNGPLLGRIQGAGTGVLPFLRNYGATPEEKAVFLYNLAKAYLGAAGDPARARAIAVELSGLGRASMARWVTGECLIQQRDVEGALGEWRAVLEIDPGNLDALFSLGNYYIDTEDNAQAERYLERAARLSSDTAAVVYTHGRNLYSLARYREAIAELRKARALPRGKDDYPVIDYLIGVSSHRLGKEAEAAEALETYLKWAYAQSALTRLEVDAHLKLAEVYDKQGKRYKAQQERQKGETLLRRIQEYAQRVGGGGLSTGSAVAGPRATDAPPAGGMQPSASPSGATARPKIPLP